MMDCIKSNKLFKVLFLVLISAITLLTVFAGVNLAFADSEQLVATSNIVVVDGGGGGGGGGGDTPVVPVVPSAPVDNASTGGSTGDFVFILISIAVVLLIAALVVMFIASKKHRKASKIGLLSIFALIFAVGGGIVNLNVAKAEAASTNSIAQISNGIVPEAFHVICPKDGSAIKYGTDEVSNTQEFTNTSDKIIKLEALSMAGDAELGQWTAKDADGNVLFQGTVNDTVTFETPISLNPGEKTSITWTTSQSSKNLVPFIGTTPGQVKYIYSYEDLPPVETYYTVNYWLVDLQGNRTSTEPFDSFYTPGIAGQLTQAQAQNKSGYNALPFEQQIIKDDGSTVIDIEYEPVNNPVTFVDESGTEITIQKVADGETASKPIAPEKTGFKFVNWYADPNFTSLFDFNQPIASATMVYAKYDPVSYNISYVLNDGAVTPATANPNSYTINDTVTLVNPTKAGYTFVGWTGTDLSEPTMKVTFTGKTGNREYTATWTPITYQVVFNAPGAAGTMPAQDFVYDEAAKALSKNDFSKEGYEFAGWGTEDSKTKVTYADKADVRNLTDQDGGKVNLYAVWTPITYKVHFNMNGGTGTQMNDQNFVYDVEQQLSTNAYTRTGYTFDGWATSDTGEKVYGENEKVKNLTKVKGTTVDLFARWAPNTDTSYKVCHWKLDKDGKRPGTATLTEDKKGTTGAPAEAVPQEYVGYTAQDPEQKTIAADGTTVVHIEYMPNSYKVHFDINGGTSGTMDDMNFVYDEEKSLPECGFSKTDFIFSGWADSWPATTSTKYYADKAPVKNLSNGSPDTVTLYAVWTDKYAVNFTDRFGAKTADVQMVAPGGKAVQPANPSRTGYNFVGWYDKAEGGSEFNFDTTTIDKNTTVYAHWTPIEYTILYDLQGGTEPDPKNPTSYNADTESFTLKEPTKTGYSFTGWTWDGQAEPKKTVTINKGTTGHLSYTANWAAADVNYIVKHLQQNLENDEYTEVTADQQKLTGKTGTLTNAVAKSTAEYPGFSAQTVAQKTIAADGSTVVEIKYDRIKYPIKFVVDADKGTYTGTLEQTLKYGATPAKPIVTAKTGYALKTEHDGWDKDVAVVTGAATYSAQFDLVEYSITYKGLEDAKVTGNPEIYTIETETFQLNNPTKTGYDFTGWTWDGQTEPKTTVEVAKGSTGNKEFTANWKPKTLTITYKDQGDVDFTGSTTGLIFKHTYGTDTTLVNTSKEHFTFGGYFTNKECTGTKIEKLDATAYTTDITLYAKWTEDPTCTVTFKSDENGRVDQTTVTVYKGSTYSIAINQVKVTDINGIERTATAESKILGYVFGYWQDASGSAITKGGTVEDNMTFKAIFIPVKWDVTFDARPGIINGKEYDTVAVNHGSTITDPSESAYRENYTLKGWLWDDAGVKKKWDFNSDIVTSNITLLADWESKIKYTVEFDSKGGSTIDSKQVGAGSLLEAPDDPTREGYIFAGWYKDVTLTSPWVFDTDKVTSDIELYAKWNVKATFDPGSGSMQEEKDKTQIVAEGGKLTKPADPTWAEGTFAGWYKEAECTTPWNFTNDTVAKEITLYAKWQFNVTFSVTGPAGSEPSKLMSFVGADVNNQITQIDSGTNYSFTYNDEENVYEFKINSTKVICNVFEGYKIENCSVTAPVIDKQITQNLPVSFVVSQQAPITARVNTAKYSVNDTIQESRGWEESTSDGDTWTKTFPYNTSNADISKEWDSQSFTGLAGVICVGLGTSTGKFTDPTKVFSPKCVGDTVTVTVQLKDDVSFISNYYDPNHLPGQAETYIVPSGWKVNEEKIETGESWPQYRYKAVSADKTYPYGTTLSQVENEFKGQLTFNSQYYPYFYHNKLNTTDYSIAAPNSLTTFLGFDSEDTVFTKEQNTVKPNTSFYEAKGDSDITIYCRSDMTSDTNMEIKMTNSSDGSPIASNEQNINQYVKSLSSENKYKQGTPISDISNYLLQQNALALKNPSSSEAKFSLLHYKKSGYERVLDKNYIFDGVENINGSDTIDSDNVILVAKWKDVRELRYQLSDGEHFTDTNWMPSGWTYDSTNKYAYKFVDIGSELFDHAQLWTSKAVIDGQTKKYVGNNAASYQTSVYSDLDGGKITGKIEKADTPIVLKSTWSSTEPTKCNVTFKIQEDQKYLGNISASTLSVDSGCTYYIEDNVIHILDQTYHEIVTTPLDDSMTVQYSVVGVTEEGKITGHTTFTASFINKQYKVTLDSLGDYNVKSVPSGWTQIVTEGKLVGGYNYYSKGTSFSEISSCWTTENISKIGHSLSQVTPNTGKLDKDTNLSVLWTMQSYKVMVEKNDSSEIIRSVPEGWTSQIDTIDNKTIISATKTYYGATTIESIADEWGGYDIVKDNALFNGFNPGSGYLESDITLYPAFSSAILRCVHIKPDETVDSIPEDWRATYYESEPTKVEFAYKNFPSDYTKWADEWTAKNISRKNSLFEGLIQVEGQVYYEAKWKTAHYAIIDINEGESYLGRVSNNWVYADGVCKKIFEEGTKYSDISDDWKQSCSYHMVGNDCTGIVESGDTPLIEDTHFNTSWELHKYTVTVSQRWDFIGSTTVSKHPEGWAESPSSSLAFTRDYPYGTDLSTVAAEWNDPTQAQFENTCYNSGKVEGTGTLDNVSNIFFTYSDVKKAKVKLQLGTYNTKPEIYVSEPEGWFYSNDDNCYYSVNEFSYDTSSSEIKKDWPVASDYITCDNYVFTEIGNNDNFFAGKTYKCTWDTPHKVTVHLCNTSSPTLESFDESNLPPFWTLADDRQSAYKPYPAGYNISQICDEWNIDNFKYAESTNYVFAGFDTAQGMVQKDITLNTTYCKGAFVKVDAGQNNLISSAPSGWALSDNKRYATKTIPLTTEILCSAIVDEWADAQAQSANTDYVYDKVSPKDTSQTKLKEGANDFEVKWKLVQYSATLQLDTDTICNVRPENWVQGKDKISWTKSFDKYTPLGQILDEWNSYTSGILKTGYTFSEFSYEGELTDQLTAPFSFKPKFSIAYYTASVVISSGETVVNQPSGWMFAGESESGMVFKKAFEYHTSCSSIASEWDACVTKTNYKYLGLSPNSGWFLGNTTFNPTWEYIETE